MGFGSMVGNFASGVGNVIGGIGNNFKSGFNGGSMGGYGGQAAGGVSPFGHSAMTPGIISTLPGMSGVNAAGGGFGTGGFNTLANWGGLASGLAQGYMAYKQMGLAEDQFDFQKGAFNANIQNQDEWNRKQARDKHNAAIGSTTAGRLMPTSEYMDEIDTVSHVG